MPTLYLVESVTQLPDVHSDDRTVVNRALRQGLNFTIQSAASDHPFYAHFLEHQEDSSKQD
jgi:hypothetical protein